MKWTVYIYCTIWLITSCIFGILAYESYQTMNTKLLYSPVKFPESHVNAQIVGLNFKEAINAMNDVTNKNIHYLESSIQRSAKLTFWLNLLSCIMAFVGFIAQISDQRNKDKRKSQ